MLLDDLYYLQRNLEKLFEKEDFPSATFSKGVFPAINIFDDKDFFILKSEMPGIEKDDIKIQIKEDSLEIRGERKFIEKKDRVYHRKERVYGSFARKFNLPFKSDTNKVSADLKDGILTIKVNKAEEIKAKSISIN